MRKQILLVGVFFLFWGKLAAQSPDLFPNATWLQDVHWAGTIYAGIGAPVMTDVQAHAGEHGELTFYLKSDVEKAVPLIDEIHAQGKQYWINLDASRLEGVTSQEIVNDGQGISDTLFGCYVSLEGHVEAEKKSITRPAWRNYVIACIKRAIEAGADGSQHDGAWPPYGSFDEDDLDAFKQYVIDRGINTYDWDYNSSTFAEYLLSKGKTDDNVFDTDNDPTEVKELINHWKTFKALRALHAWQTIKDSCQTFAQSLGKEYTLALNSRSAFGTKDGHVYFASDYYIGEFFDWGNYFPLTGSITVKAQIAEAFGKRFVCWSSPTLEDLDDGDPNTGYGVEIESQAEMALAAQLYASGGLPQLKYPSDRTYPVFFLAQNNSDLLNSVAPYGEIAVLMSQAQVIRDTRGLEGLLLALQDINRSTRVLWLKSNVLDLQDDFSLSDLENFKAVFLPEVFYLTDQQKNVLLDYMNNGGTVIAVRGNVEYCGQYDENGNENTVSEWSALANQSNSGIVTYGSGRYINIAHNILESNGYPPPLYGQAYLNDKADPSTNDLAVAIRDTIRKWVDTAIPTREVEGNALPSYVRFFRYQDSTEHRYLYQVLADSVVLATREPVPVPSFQVQIAVSPNSYDRLFSATWYSIDNPDGIEIGSDLTVDATTGRVTVTIPEFSRWGFVHLDGSGSAANPLRLGNLAINGSTQFRRLKSKSRVTGTWDVLSGSPDHFEVEIWSNLRQTGDPVVSNQVLGKISSASDPETDAFSKTYLTGAVRLLSVQLAAATTEYTVPDSALHDSLVYLFRVRAVQSSDTSDWIQSFFYRNAPPGAPFGSQIFTACQNLWYTTDGTNSPPDTSYFPVIAFNKAPNYGGDYELDSLLFGIYVYTDSLPGKQGDTLSAMHLIGKQFKHKLAWNESMPDTRGDIQDTIGFSLAAYENYGIYFRVVATDNIDTSAFSPWFWFYLDNHNDPPNPFHLIAPANNSILDKEVPFVWQNNGDPDPFDKENLTISRVEVLFDSVPTFDSPGLRVYSKDRSGNEFEQDTISLDLPSDFFHAEGLDTYDRVYWKARLYDYDWHSADGSHRLFRESTETFTFSIGDAAQELKPPVQKMPENHAQDLPLQVRLEWDAVPEAQFYALQIARDGSFQNVLVDIPNFKGTNFTVENLQANTTYYWRVKSGNGGAQSAWSPTWDFKTLSVPQAVVLIAPEDQYSIDSDTLQLVWHQAVPFADRYCVEYDTDPAFVHPVSDSAVVDTLYRLKELVGGKTYYWRVKAQNAAGWGPYSEVRSFKVDLTGIAGFDVPDSYRLFQNYPNPFNPTTHIAFSLPEEARVKIELFNANGQKVTTLLDGKKRAGFYELRVEMQHLPSGIYFYRMTTPSYRSTRKMILLR